MKREDFMNKLIYRIKVNNNLTKYDPNDCCYDEESEWLVARSSLHDCKTVGQVIAWMWNEAWDIESALEFVLECVIDDPLPNEFDDVPERGWST